MNSPSPSPSSLLAILQQRLRHWASSGSLERAAGEALGLAGPSHTLSSLNGAWARGDFSRLPALATLPGPSLPGVAGAYVRSTATIYLNADWLASQPEEAALAVLTEELGHWLDHQINSSETPGDEGELLARLLLGPALDDQERRRLGHENDAVMVRLNDGSPSVGEAAAIPGGATLLVVTTSADQTDGSASNGLSLREAILLANANPDQEYTIQLAGGSTYFLAASGADEDLGFLGDLDISARTRILTIEATGVGNAIINASRLLITDRVLDVSPGGLLALDRLTISGGITSDNGGGLRIAQGGYAYVASSEIANNQGVRGGGISNSGTLYLTTGSSVSANMASGFAPSGGGIHNDGTLMMRDSTIAGNDGGSFGGGLRNSKTATLINTSVIGNTANSGGGIMNTYGSAQLSLLNTTVSGNTASLGGAGGIANDGGLATLVNSTVTNNSFSGILGYAGGISNEGRANGVTLRNSIVAGNVKTDQTFGNKPDLTGSFRGDAFNLIGSLAGASGTGGPRSPPRRSRRQRRRPPQPCPPPRQSRHRWRRQHPDPHRSNR
jgi:CSLREA domain-containing protein